MLSLPNVKRLPKLNRRQRSIIMVQKGPSILFALENSQCYWKHLIFSHCLDSLYIQILLKDVHLTWCVLTELLLGVVSTLGHITEQCFSPKPGASFKKNKSQWAEHGVDSEMSLFPLLDAAALQKRDAAETDLGALKTISKVAWSFLCLPAKDLRQKRNFGGPDPYSPVCRQKRRHTTASYRHIFICAHVFLGFSNSEGAPPFLLYLSSSIRTSPTTKGIFSHSWVNIWGDQKGCAELPTDKGSSQNVQVSSSGTNSKKNLLCFTWWKVPYLLRR